MRSTTGRPDAKPFDIIIIGGGSFGGALAQHLLYSDKFKAHRILVLEAGPFVLAEHAQNLPTLGLVAPGPTEIDPGVPSAEVWGLPWRTDVPKGFPGLAYCVGGRSVFWGGWSPELLDAEMPPSRWPAQVVQDLKSKYFAEAGVQIGVDQTNDFIFGDMHEALRQLLFDGPASGRRRYSPQSASGPADGRAVLQESKSWKRLWPFRAAPLAPGFFRSTNSAPFR